MRETKIIFTINLRAVFGVPDGEFDGHFSISDGSDARAKTFQVSGKVGKLFISTPILGEQPLGWSCHDFVGVGEMAIEVRI